jgi:hypothetical protein
MSSTYSKIVQGPKTVLIRSKQENIEFSVPSGHHVVLPEATDFSNCASSLNDVVSVDLSGKQDANAKLTQLSGLSGDENQVVAFNGDGELVAINQASAPTYNAPLSVNGSNEVSFDDTGFLKSADLGVTVQGYDATTLKSADIGVSVQGYDSSILKSADIGVLVQGYDANILTSDAIGDTVQAKNEHLDEFIALHGVAWANAIPYFNEANGAFELTDSNQIQVWGNMQESHANLTAISNLTPTENDILYYNGTSISSASKQNLNIQPLNSKLSDISGLSGTEGKFLKFSSGQVVEGDASGLTFSAPLSETDNTVIFDDTGFMKLSGNQTVEGHKNFTGTLSYDENMVVQHRCESSSGYIHYKRDRLFKQSFNDTNANSLFGNIYYANDREVVVDVEITAIDVDSSPKRMHVHKLSCVTLNGSVLDNQHEIVYEPATGESLGNAFAWGLSGSNLSLSVTQPSTKKYNYSVFVVDRAVLNS